MKTTLLRAGALACALLASTALTAPALAQTAQAHRNLDANGVDLTHGDFLMSVVEGSIGSGEAELPLVRNGIWYSGSYTVNGHQWDRVHFQETQLSGGGTRWTVNIGPRFEQFDSTGTLPSGSSLTGGGNNFVYRSADGTAIEFSDAGQGGWGTDTNFCTGLAGQGNCVLLPTAISEPDGKTVNLGWNIWTYCWGMIDGENLPCNFTPRLGSVSNSFGYSIQFTYSSDGSGGGAKARLAVVRTQAAFQLD